MFRRSKLPSRHKQRGYFIIDQYRNGDQYFTNVVLLCHCDDLISSGTFLNVVKQYGRGEVLSGFGDADTTQKLFGRASHYVHNANPRYVSSASHADYAFGTGDFTIEFATYTTTISADILFDMRPTSTQGAYAALSCDASGNLFYFLSNATRITGTGVLVANRWQRIAVSRISGVTRMFVDGVKVGSNYTDTANYLQSRVVFGASSFTLGSSPYDGWMDEFRITKGVGRYLNNYTVASSAFPDHGN